MMEQTGQEYLNPFELVLRVLYNFSGSEPMRIEAEEAIEVKYNLIRYD